ncbi:arrestin [Setomelanomma holmii]|uniref:Arrestin n=1 Tax=Setomelanomma holmii TaxID=210430 RepID=A0A9P4HFD8_9PLEO|nr:arrestin [Setomelanomma holmii]
MPSSTRASVVSHANTMGMQSMCNQVGYKVRNMTHYGQPSINISLGGNEGPRSTWVTSYSTMDTIEGTITITTSHDTRFEDIDIAFIGSSQVFVDRLTTTPTMTGRTEANHRFLVLRQPIDESDFPTPRMFEAGRSYKFPFTFTVPSQLLPKSCSHKVSSDHVRECHLMLPPSLGDPDLAGFGGTLLDDLAPEMSKIGYAIKVRIAHQRGTEGISVLAEKFKKVRIKPAFIEQPPLNIDGSDEYRSKQVKTLRKGLFKGKLGTLSAKTIQPKPLVIPGTRTTDNKPITTMAKVVLRFDPSEDDHEPPKLGSMATKLKVTTWFASAPRQGLPTRHCMGFDVTQGAYSENVSLSSLCIASAQWERHDAAENPTIEDNLVRRDSGISDCSANSTDAETAFVAGFLSASKDYKNGTFYTTQILVPISLPGNKNFIPTFHSCIVSRTYTLGLQFAGQVGSGMHLKVPIQICADGSESGIQNARARSVEETQLQEAADIWAPRSVAPPSFGDIDSGNATRNNSVGGRDEPPPDYAAFAPPSRRYRNSVAA